MDNHNCNLGYAFPRILPLHTNPSKETRLKLSKARKGKHLSKETKKKLSKNNAKYWLGKHRPEKTKRKLSVAHRLAWKKNPNQGMAGKCHSKESKLKMSDAQKGEKSRCWLGGISFEPYPPKFNKQLKMLIRERDNFTCQECKQTEKKLGYDLATHHIDYNKKNCDPDNLISLCKPCHAQTNFDRKDWTNYFKNLHH